MLTLLNNWKLYILSFALIGALSLNAIQRIKMEKIENKVTICQGNLAANMVAIQAASEMRTRQEQQLRLREQDAAKARAESQKRMDKIMESRVPEDCEGAHAWLIDQALGFHWHNNIP
jgi:hypothetical protein